MRGGERGGVEGVAERLGAEAGEERVGVERGGRPRGRSRPKRRASLKVRRAPSSRSRTTWSCFSGRRVRVVEDADRGAGDEDAAGHAEVDDQGLAAVEVGEQVLRAAAQRVDAGAGEAGGEAAAGSGQRRSGRRTSARAMHAAGQDRLEAAADGLDLGQLGQGGSSGACGRRGCQRAPALPYKEARKRPEGRGPMTDPTSARPTSASRPCPRTRRRGGCTGVFALGRLALRPDERRDEPRRPPAVEGRDARLAGAAAGDAAARRRRRDRRHRLPLPAPGEGRRATRPCST